MVYVICTYMNFVMIKVIVTDHYNYSNGVVKSYKNQLYSACDILYRFENVFECVLVKYL